MFGLNTVSMASIIFIISKVVTKPLTSIDTFLSKALRKNIEKHNATMLKITDTYNTQYDRFTVFWDQ